MRDTLSPMRSFEPTTIGRQECAAWVAYYRRQWARFLWSAVGMVRAGFRLPWPKTVYGAYLVLRANQLWAPVPDNDPDGARRTMQRFYRLIVRTHGEHFEPTEAARLEVEWWRVHRYLQREAPHENADELTDALTALYAHVYRTEATEVRQAAAERAEAMRISDRWVAAGCDPESPALLAERAALVRSYAALLAAVHHQRN